MIETRATKYSGEKIGIVSPFVLDLSIRPKVQKINTSRVYGKKIIGILIFLAVFALTAAGIDFYKKIREIKWRILNVQAIDETNLEEINKILDVVKYLPATGEAGKIKELAADFENFKNILGFDWPKKYLLIFQNPSEARATGGFIGSIGVLKVAKGKIENVTINDVYDLDGQLKTDVEPPEPIKKISASWSLHDANWFFDFPSSARKIWWFYEKAGGETPDGVIAVNPEAVRKILSITGPVKLEKYNIELNEENFIEEIQRQAEINYDKTINQPKTILPDFLKELRNKMENLSLGGKISIAKTLSFALGRKDIQLFFRDSGPQEFVLSRGWAAQVKESDKDYLAIVHSNINGFKSDAMMAEEAALVSEISSDGQIINTLTIFRKNRGSDKEDEWYNKVNSDYLRIYVPKGAKLLSASGATKEQPFLKDPSVDYSQYFKDSDLINSQKVTAIDETSGVRTFSESGKTVFGAWVYTSPGEKTAVSFRYILPFKIDFNNFSSKNDSYTLLVQKQSGSKLEKINHKLTFPESWKLAGQTISDSIFSVSGNKIEEVLDAKTDKFSGLVFSRGQ